MWIHFAKLAMQQTERTFKNKLSGAIGVAGVAHGKSRRKLRKRIRRIKPAGDSTSRGGTKAMAGAGGGPDRRRTGSARHPASRQHCSWRSQRRAATSLWPLAKAHSMLLTMPSTLLTQTLRAPAAKAWSMACLTGKICTQITMRLVARAWPCGVGSQTLQARHRQMPDWQLELGPGCWGLVDCLLHWQS